MAVSLGRLEVETADHVVLRYDLAGGGNRGFAALVDFILATLIFIGAFFMFSLFSGLVGFESASPFFGIAALLTFAVAWSYFILLEWLGNGQTIGKRMFGLRVIADDGAPAGFTAVLVRNLVRMVDFLPGFYGFGLLAIVVSSRSQRLGDLAAGTFVVRAPRPQLDYFRPHGHPARRRHARRDPDPARRGAASGPRVRRARGEARARPPCARGQAARGSPASVCARGRPRPRRRRAHPRHRAFPPRERWRALMDALWFGLLVIGVAALGMLAGGGSRRYDIASAALDARSAREPLTTHTDAKGCSCAVRGTSPRAGGSWPRAGRCSRRFGAPRHFRLVV